MRLGRSSVPLDGRGERVDRRGERVDRRGPACAAAGFGAEQRRDEPVDQGPVRGTARLGFVPCVAKTEGVVGRLWRRARANRARGRAPEGETWNRASRTGRESGVGRGSRALRLEMAAQCVGSGLPLLVLKWKRRVSAAASMERWLWRAILQEWVRTASTAPALNIFRRALIRYLYIPAPSAVRRRNERCDDKFTKCAGVREAEPGTAGQDVLMYQRLAALVARPVHYCR